MRNPSNSSVRHPTEYGGRPLTCAFANVSESFSPAFLAMLSRFVSATAFALGLIVAMPAWPQGTLRVSAIPDEAPAELQRKFAPLGRYLEQRRG